MEPEMFEVDEIRLEFGHLTTETKLMVSAPGMDYPILLRKEAVGKLVRLLETCLMEWDAEDEIRLAAIDERRKTAEKFHRMMYGEVPTASVEAPF